MSDRYRSYAQLNDSSEFFCGDIEILPRFASSEHRFRNSAATIVWSVGQAFHSSCKWSVIKEELESIYPEGVTDHSPGLVLQPWEKNGGGRSTLKGWNGAASDSTRARTYGNFHLYSLVPPFQGGNSLRRFQPRVGVPTLGYDL